MDYSLPGSSVHGILQARVLEWIAISFSKIPFSWHRGQTWVSFIVGKFFTIWATREAHVHTHVYIYISISLSACVYQAILWDVS